MTPASLSLDDIKAAHARIRDKIHRTPVLTSESLDGQAGGSIFFKCENFQKIGAFKARGATNAIFQIPEDEATKGVAIAAFCPAITPPQWRGPRSCVASLRTS